MLSLKKLTILKLAIVIINLLIAIISITSLYTVASGEFNVLLPEKDDISWEVQDDQFVFTTNVTIQNGGLYPIEDLSIHIGLVEENSNYSLIDYNHIVELIPKQTDSIEFLEIPLDLDFNEWLDAGLDTLIFEDSTLILSVNVEAYYTMKLVRFYADYTLDSPWSAPIKEYEIFPSEIVPNFDNDNIAFELPYRLHTADWLTGEIILEATIRNDVDEITKATEIIPLGLDHHDSLLFIIDSSNSLSLITESQTIFIDITISTSEFGVIYTDTMTYEWSAPLDNLKLGDWDIDYLNDILSLPLSFTNNLEADFNYDLITTLLDENGIELGEATSLISVIGGESINEIIDINYSGTGEPESVELTFIDNESGESHTIILDLGQP
jgi:hypothetical protein